MRPPTRSDHRSGEKAAPEAQATRGSTEMTKRGRLLFSWLSDPRLLEMLSASACFGFGVVWLSVKLFHLPYTYGSSISAFGPLAPLCALIMLVAGATAIYATIINHCMLRSTCAVLLFVAYGWFASYFLIVQPPLLVQGYIYLGWSLLEGLIFVRVVNNLGGTWR